MLHKKSLSIGLALSGIGLLVAASYTQASPDKKKPTKPTPAAAAAAQKALIEGGKKVYLVAGCKACHAIGEDKGGKTGPELTHVAKTCKPDWLSAQVRDP